MADYYYEVRVSIVCGGQFSQIVHNFVIDLATPPDDVTAARQLRDTLDDGGVASYFQKLRNCLSEDAFISAVRVRQVGPTGGNTVTIAFEPADLPGLVAEPIAPLQVAGCVIFVNSVDPDRTGRTFVPGVPQTYCDGSRWTSAAVVAYQAFGDRLIGGFTAALGTFNAVMLDRATKTGPVIDGCYVSPKLGTQRRRELPV